MAEKFLNKEGLDRFLEKIKKKFAPIENPTFSGKVAVDTPKFEKYSDAKEVVNKEYVSNLYKTVMEDMYKDPQNIVLRFNIQPSDWKGDKSPFYCTRLTDMFHPTDDIYISCIVQILYNEISREDAIEIHRKCVIESGLDCQIYLIGEKPLKEIPIKVHLFISRNMSSMFSEGED